MSETFPHVVEAFVLDGTTIGALIERYVIEAVDSKEALLQAKTHDHERYIIAIYQGNLERFGRRPVGFAGRYSLDDWRAILRHYGSVELVQQALASRRGL